ncbi:hypothetical protein [Actinoalloteichus caeruleus]|uniref:DNA recombination-mediator protein A n=1 Tax=Actinoalloteichus caeruleus DSM 43889 TaxID=1120930 RepID=A0ABT1JEZ7_ACTCY|nr:hypothetical protein [Actinoalloteichus caeruleus]MCP2331074.1 hypothetical protein [Actinoalloteichus caeruleus DSM 43889]
MTCLAITGHRGLGPDTEELVATELRRTLAKRADELLVGMSCVADGADTLFARSVLDAGGSLVVVVPAAQYRDSLPAGHRPVYDALLARATDVVRLGYQRSTSESHMRAGVRMVEEADELVAVWDGEPARGYGGTADVVRAARERGVPVTVVWPEGAHRD